MTSSLLAVYRLERSELPKFGQRSSVVDSFGRLAAVV